GWAQRRYEQAVADRKVIGYRNPDGSANLSGLNLPVDRVAAACGHIDALAKAAKHAGDSRSIDHIRADLFLGMTDGTYTGLDDVAILDKLRTTHHSDDEGPDDEGPDGEPGDGPGDDGPDGPDDGGGAAEGGGCAAGDLVKPRGLAGAGMELRVRLSTLLGRDEYPGELAGWGPIHAELACDLATTMARGQWRFAITDEHGHLLHCGITPARPTGTPTRAASFRQIVELQIPATTLHDLASDPDGLGTWAPVITDLAHQHATAQRPLAGDPTRRTPGAALRRHVQIRDRHCIMIGCRAPAYGTDTDHILDHARSGATVERNLGNACRHDHRLKHEGGWQLHQPEPGLFRWISRLGHVYPVRPSPIIEPLPDPIPGYGPAPPLPVRPDDDWDESSIWDDTSPEADTTPSPRPPPEPDAHDEAPPPF
ncbi:MAG: HNH endonuclease signature motif containing protein, partial [Pseudonocardiaceae bacterium]